MVARQRSTSPKQRFNANWIAVVPVKVKLPRNGRRKIAAKFFPAFLKARRSVRRLQFWFATKMRDRRIMPRSQRNFGRRMPISLTRPSTELEIGRVVDVRQLAKRSPASPLA